MPAAAAIRISVTRIVVPLDTAPDTLRALEAAVALAEGLERPVEAVFIEDPDLLSLAALPFSREIALSGRPSAHLDPLRVERELRARARRLEREVERLARARRVAWRFQVVRGRAEEELRRLRQAGDVVALGPERLRHALEDGTLLMGRHARLRMGPVVPLEGERPDPELEGVAAALAAHSGQPIRPVPALGTDPVGRARLFRRLEGVTTGLIVARRGVLDDDLEPLLRRLPVPLLLLP
jgi:hypothetical protein